MSILGQFQFRRDLASAWSTVNPILLEGELGIESDTDLFKIGDGTTPWNILPYGGLQGMQGIQGQTGVNGATGNDGWSPVLANQVDGERRVLRLIDWIGGTGTKPAVPTNNYIGATGFTNLAGATDIRGATGVTGATGAAGQGSPATNQPTSIEPDDTSSIGTVTTRYALEDHQHAIVAATPVALGATASEGTATSFARSDHVHINPVIAHEAASDPHPQYLTQQEGDDRYNLKTDPPLLQRQANQLTANVTLPTTNAQVALTSITLSPGIWFISAHATFTRTATTAGKFSIMIGPNNVVGNAYASSTIDHASLANVYVEAAVSNLVVITDTTTVTLYGAHSAGATSNIVRAMNVLNAPGATAISAIKVSIT